MAKWMEDERNLSTPRVTRHGPLRNGGLADIVQVDPHVHAFIPLTIIRLFTRPYAIPSYDHHDLHFQS